MDGIGGFATGHCACGDISYRMLSPPMIVHCCHCSWCQRETGSAFAVNALLERDRLEIDSSPVETTRRPSASGQGQTVHSCPRCRTVLWSHYNYAGIGAKIAFVRAGTLDDPGLAPPDVHIFTSTKQSWLPLPGNSLVYPEYYRAKDVWSQDSLARRAALFD